MKKTFLAVLAAALLFCLSLSGCKSAPGRPTGDAGLHIVTTIFPEYDWVRNVLGKNPNGAKLTLLLDSGVDLHSYQPSVADISVISHCDLFVYVGGESEKWVAKALEEADNPNMVVINLLDVLGDAAKEEELAEGMQPEDHDHDDHDDEVEYDEHVWLSLRNTALFVDSILQGMIKLDSVNAEYYRSQAEDYLAKLNALDREYEEAVASASVRTLLFGDRFPFRYLTEDYGLSYYAAFVGCSSETEASFETIAFLAQKMDELSLHSVLTIEGSDGRIARTIVENTQSKDQQILALNSMQATTAADIRNGTTYLSIMEQNLKVLKQALK
ncbi:MAG: zinc ABC transporter substrate-binding protein [Firmicutes bacterium]|nr:zinc ABC transporter substrate-binding protein [Bacillota bacterium]